MLFCRQFGNDKPELNGAMACVMKQMKSKSAYRLGNMKEPHEYETIEPTRTIWESLENVDMIMRKNVWKQFITYVTSTMTGPQCQM